MEGSSAPRKEEFKDAGFALEQDGCAPEIFESQHRSMGSRPTLPLTGFGSSPRRFAARLAAEARRLACGSARATKKNSPEFHDCGFLSFKTSWI